MKTCSDLQSYLAMSLAEKIGTYLEEDQVAKLHTIENNSPLVDLRYFDSDKLLAFSQSMEIFLFRREAAEQLLKSAKNLLALGFELEIHETYREYHKQRMEFEQISHEIKQKYPDLLEDGLWKEVTKFIADPDLCPPHITGGAVDLRLLYIDGKAVDMGTEINTISEESYLLNSHIEHHALAHRKILLSEMLHTGFAPMPTEWWHYSYGEKYWGAFYNRFAIFDIIKDTKSFLLQN